MQVWIEPHLCLVRIGNNITWLRLFSDRLVVTIVNLDYSAVRPDTSDGFEYLSPLVYARIKVVRHRRRLSQQWLAFRSGSGGGCPLEVSCAPYPAAMNLDSTSPGNLFYRVSINCQWRAQGSPPCLKCRRKFSYETTSYCLEISFSSDSDVGDSPRTSRVRDPLAGGSVRRGKRFSRFTSYYYPTKRPNCARTTVLRKSCRHHPGYDRKSEYRAIALEVLGAVSAQRSIVDARCPLKADFKRSAAGRSVSRTGVTVGRQVFDRTLGHRLLQ